MTDPFEELTPKKNWDRMVQVARIDASRPGGPILTSNTPSVLWADAELSRLRSLATRWYLADGTFETLPEEEVTRRRKEAAKRAGDAGLLARAMFNATEDMDSEFGRWADDFDDLGPRGVEMWEKAARAIAAYLAGKVTG